MCLGSVFGGWGGVLGGCFQINVGVLGGDLSAVRHSFSRGGRVRGDSESLEGTLTVLETFFPKRCSRPRLLPV